MIISSPMNKLIGAKVKSKFFFHYCSFNLVDFEKFHYDKKWLKILTNKNYIMQLRCAESAISNPISDSDVCLCLSNMLKAESCCSIFCTLLRCMGQKSSAEVCQLLLLKAAF
jgi:hypothetical protein